MMNVYRLLELKFLELLDEDREDIDGIRLFEECLMLLFDDLKLIDNGICYNGSSLNIYVLNNKLLICNNCYYAERSTDNSRKDWKGLDHQTFLYYVEQSSTLEKIEKCLFMIL